MNSLPLTAPQSEQLRQAVREVLAPRQGSAFPASVIRKRIEKEMLLDFPVNDDNVTIAAQFLSGMNPPQTKSATDEVGSSVYWMITSDGVLAHERNIKA
jgi:hypothetical protein